MPARKMSMRKLREVLRLRYELKLGYQQIGRSCAIAVSTVHKYLKRAEAASVTWPLPEDWDEAHVEAALFPEAAAPSPPHTLARPLPDFAAIHDELRKNKHVTLQLLWEEYRQANPDGYRYSRFCYRAWAAVSKCPSPASSTPSRRQASRRGPSVGRSVRGCVHQAYSRGRNAWRRERKVWPHSQWGIRHWLT